MLIVINLLLRILRGWVKLPFLVAEIVFAEDKSKADELVMGQICKAAEKKSDYFFTFNMRPKSTSTFPYPACVHYGADGIAIVLQGPLDVEDSFTLETVKLYSSLYENVTIIVSTWVDADPNAVRELENAGAHVVTSEHPRNPGYGNINYQLKSTQAGIDRALSMGASYICKTRTDQRIYAPGAITYFKDLVEAYPVAGGVGDHGRIVCLTAEYASMLTPFYISDFLYFGRAQDIERLLDLPCRSDSIEKPQDLTRAQVASRMTNSESYIAYSYAKKLEAECASDVEAYMDFLARNMIVVDKSQIGFYWHKYDARYRDHARNGFCHIGSSPERYMNTNVGAMQWEQFVTGSMRLDDSVELLAAESFV